MTFRSVTAAIVWWVWLLFAAGNLIDLAVEGHDHLALLAAAILVMVTGVAYVTGQRPRVIVGDDALTVRNPVRDHIISWPNVIRADLADLLRIKVRDQSGERAISAWAVHYSRRKKFTSQAKSRRAELREGRGGRGGLGGSMGGSMGGAFGGAGLRTAGPAQQRTDVGSAEAEAERAMRLINDRVDATITDATGAASANADVTDAMSTAVDDASADVGVHDAANLAAAAVRSTWNWPAVAALVIPAVLLLIVALI